MIEQTDEDEPASVKLLDFILGYDKKVDYRILT